MLFLVERLAPWSGNRAHRLIKTPKLHVSDTGLCAALLGVDAEALLDERQLARQLLETFALRGLRRQATWHEDDHRFFHYRDKDKAEVDIVAKRFGSALAGVETESSATASMKDFRGLGHLASLASERFAGSAVLHTDDHVVPFGPTLRAVPPSML